MTTINPQLKRISSKIERHAYGFQCKSQYLVFQNGDWCKYSECQLGTSEFVAQSNCDRQAGLLTDDARARETAEREAYWAEEYRGQNAAFLAEKSAGRNPLRVIGTNNIGIIVFASLGKYSFEQSVKTSTEAEAIATVEANILAKGAK